MLQLLLQRVHLGLKVQQCVSGALGARPGRALILGRVLLLLLRRSKLLLSGRMSLLKRSKLLMSRVLLLLLSWRTKLRWMVVSGRLAPW